MFDMPVNEMLGATKLAATAILPESPAETAADAHLRPRRLSTAKKINRNLKFFQPHIRLI
jgi:hypothetical protein